MAEYHQKKFDLKTPGEQPRVYTRADARIILDSQSIQGKLAQAIEASADRPELQACLVGLFKALEA